MTGVMIKFYPSGRSDPLVFFDQGTRKFTGVTDDGSRYVSVVE